MEYNLKIKGCAKPNVKIPMTIIDNMKELYNLLIQLFIDENGNKILSQL